MRRPAHLSLPLAAASAWATAAGGMFLPVSALARLTAAAGVAAVVFRRKVLVVALFVGVSLAAASAALHLHALHSGPVAGLAKRHAEADVVLRLVRDPQPVVSDSGLLLVDATVIEVASQRGRHANAPVLLFVRGPGWKGLLPGQRVEVTGRFEPPRSNDSVAAVVDVGGDPQLLGRPPWWQRIAGHARAALQSACDGLPDDARGLLPGLVDGDTTLAPASLQTDMRVTGLTHLEAVSGENLTIMLGVVMSVARGSGLRRRGRAILAALGVLGFVCFARPSPSVLRAAVMSAVMLTAMLAGRRTAALPTLSFAVLALVVIDPFLARSVGFVLSVVATAAIMLIAPTWTRRLERSLPTPIAVAIAVPAAAQLACTPVLVLAFGQLTPYAVPANLVAGPAVAPATVLGVVAAAVASISVGLARPIVWMAALPTALIAWTAHGFAALPGAGVTLSRSAGILVAVGAALVLLLAARAASHDPVA